MQHSRYPDMLVLFGRVSQGFQSLFQNYWDSMADDAVGTLSGPHRGGSDISDITASGLGCWWESFGQGDQEGLC